MTRTKKLLWCIGSSANILSQKYLIITNMVQICLMYYRLTTRFKASLYFALLAVSYGRDHNHQEHKSE